MVITAADIMTSPAVFVTPETNMADLASLLALKRYSSVPVCHPDRTIAGLVEESEVLRPFRESVRARRGWWLGRLGEGEEPPQDFLDYIRRDTRIAADVMIRVAATTRDDAPLPELANLMIKHGVKRLPVLRDGKIVGIVSQADLVTALARNAAVLP